MADETNLYCHQISEQLKSIMGLRGGRSNPEGLKIREQEWDDMRLTLSYPFDVVDLLVAALT